MASWSTNKAVLRKDYVDLPHEEATDGKWNAEAYGNNAEMQIVQMSSDCVEFDVFNVHPCFVNVLRRVMVAEVPTVAIDRVHLFQNTSVICDEILAHRLGLVPLKVNPSKISAKNPDEDMNEKNSLLFRLNVKCKEDATKSVRREGKSVVNAHVYSSELTWVPLPGQEAIFKKKQPRPAVGDILLARLNVGQEIECDCYCIKSNGRDHAKFSPVAACFYRFHPEVTLLKDIFDDQADLLKAHMTKGVIETDRQKDGRRIARVANERLEMLTGNHFRLAELADVVSVSCKMDHIIFTVESVGQMKAAKVVMEAFRVMKDKCTKLISELELG